MAQNIQQIYTANPSTELLVTDLVYIGKSPYGPANNSAILAGSFFINDFDAQFNSLHLDGSASVDSYIARKTTNQLVLGTTLTTTISATAPASSSVYTIPDVGTSANFVMTAGTQSIGGEKTFSSDVSVVRAQSGGDVIFRIENNSATSGSNVYCNLYVNNSGTGNSVYRCGHQNVAGQKYSWGFDNDDSDAFVFSVGDTLGTANAMRCSTTGNFSFNNAVTLSATTNQLVLGVTNTTTITSPAPSASRVYTIPDAGAAANFLMSQGTQTISGANTFANATLSQSVSTVGSANTFTVENTDNSNASSDAVLKIAVGGINGGDPYVLFSRPSATSYSMGANNADGAFVLSVGTALGTNNAIHCDISGRINYPTQPRFLAYNSATDTNATGDGTLFTVICDTETFDIGSNYNNGTGVFTAPITGVYRFDASVTASSVGAAHTFISQDLIINGSTIIATESGMSPGVTKDSSNNFCTPQCSRLISLTAGDTVNVRVSVNGSTKTVGILGNAFYSTFFSGMLVA